MRGYTQLTKVLCESGSNVAAVDNRGRTALHLAARNDDRALVEYLMRQGNGLGGETAFGGETSVGAIEEVVHASRRRRNFLNDYLDNGGDKFAVDAITGRTCLHFAAINDLPWIHRLFTLGRLLNEGLELEVRDKNGETPLHRVAAYGDQEVIQRLVEKGADLSAVNNRGQTPLLVSTAYNRKEASIILLKHGSDVQVADQDSNTALHFAVHEPSILEVLITAGGSVNAANAHG